MYDFFLSRLDRMLCDVSNYWHSFSQYYTFCAPRAKKAGKYNVSQTIGKRKNGSKSWASEI